MSGDGASPDTPRGALDYHLRVCDGHAQWPTADGLLDALTAAGYFLVRDGEAVHQGKVHRLEADSAGSRCTLHGVTYVSFGRTEPPCDCPCSKLLITDPPCTWMPLWRLVEETP